jgi:uncharacterized membrane protein YfcA
MFDFSLAVAVVAFLAGTVASVAGFGIGSLLTPLLALHIGTKVAVAAVAIPHLVGTALRCWMLRKDIDKRVLLGFGITSAFGGLAGALFHNYLQAGALTVIFGVILIFAGSIGLGGWNERMRFHGPVAWIAGAISGGLGGLVGNQGGIRSAALFGFDLQPKAFVATATAIGIVVDAVRLPVYLIADGPQILTVYPLLLIATTGVVIGTCCGMFLLQGMDSRKFKRIVSGIILALGIWMLLRASG